MPRIYLFLSIFFIYSQVNAQKFETFTLPHIPADTIQALQADVNNFAYPFYTLLNVKELASTWIADDSIHYALIIVSPGAFSLNIIFSDFCLPQGSLLTLSDASKKQQEIISRGSFSTPSLFAAPLIGGDTLIMHIQEPVVNSSHSRFVIGQISHGFKDIGIGTSRLKAADCHIGINCPEASEWRAQKNSVCRLIINGKRYCTGTLVNNTAENGEPYVLTANHCLKTENEALSTIFYFNYEYADCSSIGNLPTNFHISGSELLATGKNNQLDFTLVRMLETPPVAFNVYYSGWDIRTEQPVGASCVHHPAGGAKRLALSDVPLQTKSFVASGTNFLANSHWFISLWSQGTTEGGSSGSALLNSNKRIIGTLTGGESSCAHPRNDYFQKLSYAWDYNSDSQYQLKSWLDPIDSGVKTCDGFFPRFTIDSIAVFSAETPMLTVSSSNVSNWSGQNEMNMHCFANEVQITSPQFIAGITAGVNNVGDLQNTSTFCVWDKNFTLLTEKEIETSRLFAQSANRIFFSQAIAVTDTFYIGVCYSQNQTSEASSLFLIDDNSPTIDGLFFNNARWTKYRSLNLNYNLALQPVITFTPYSPNPDLLNIIPYALPRQRFATVAENADCRVFPQPAGDWCKLQFLNTLYKSVDCSLFDLHGSRVWTGSVVNTDGVHLIPLQQLMKGVYVLQIKAGNSTQVVKIVKAK